MAASVAFLSIAVIADIVFSLNPLAPLLGFIGLYAVSGWQAHAVRIRGEHLLARVGRGERLAVRVALVQPRGFQRPWSRPRAMLTLGGGQLGVALLDPRRRPDPLVGPVIYPLDRVGFLPGGPASRRGVTLLFPDGHELHFSFVATFCPAVNLSPFVDRDLGAVMARTLQQLAAQAAAELPAAGWYPDPGGPAGRTRWWDGRGWTAHLR